MKLKRSLNCKSKEEEKMNKTLNSKERSRAKLDNKTTKTTALDEFKKKREEKLQKIEEEKKKEEVIDENNDAEHKKKWKTNNIYSSDSSDDDMPDQDLQKNVAQVPVHPCLHSAHLPFPQDLGQDQGLRDTKQKG